MAEKTLAGKTVEVTDEGYLVNSTDWTKEVAVELAKEDSNVIGARMMGGGFGGCTINMIANNSVKSFTKKTSEAYFKKFGIKCSIYFIKLSNGTHLIENATI